MGGVTRSIATIESPFSAGWVTSNAVRRSASPQQANPVLIPGRIGSMICIARLTVGLPIGFYGNFGEPEVANNL
jgi:hypothetical protein